jgi:hypothetical protein
MSHYKDTSLGIEFQLAKDPIGSRIVVRLGKT